MLTASGDIRILTQGNSSEWNVEVPKGCLPRGIHASHLGEITKKNKPTKWHLIVDLSAPQEGKVNDGIDSKLSFLSYLSIDHLAALVLSEGRESLLVKADIKETYRTIPVHPEDQHLLGVQWKGTVYSDWTGYFPLDCIQQQEYF